MVDLVHQHVSSFNFHPFGYGTKIPLVVFSVACQGGSTLDTTHFVTREVRILHEHVSSALIVFGQNRQTCIFHVYRCFFIFSMLLHDAGLFTTVSQSKNWFFAVIGRLLIFQELNGQGFPLKSFSSSDLDVCAGGEPGFIAGINALYIVTHFGGERLR